MAQTQQMKVQVQPCNGGVNGCLGFYEVSVGKLIVGKVWGSGSEWTHVNGRDMAQSRAAAVANLLRDKGYQSEAQKIAGLNAE